jgi:hypothetical protein
MFLEAEYQIYLDDWLTGAPKNFTSIDHFTLPALSWNETKLELCSNIRVIVGSGTRVRRQWPPRLAVAATHLQFASISLFQATLKHEYMRHYRQKLKLTNRCFYCRKWCWFWLIVVIVVVYIGIKWSEACERLSKGDDNFNERKNNRGRANVDRLIIPVHGGA